MEDKKIFYGNTKLQFGPATLEEQGFCFDRGTEEIGKACIGYLLGDFGELGKVFHKEWVERNDGLKTEHFEAELEDVVGALRKEGILANRFEMQKRMLYQPNAIIKNQYRPEAAFRIETQQNLFFLRCIPSVRNHNFFCYVYDKEQFYAVQRVQKNMPNTCWSLLKSTGELILLRYGMKGYFPMNITGYEKADAQQIVNDLNEEVNISKAQVAAMEVGSLFGWNIPAADARNYDEQGRLLSATKPEKEYTHER